MARTCGALLLTTFLITMPVVAAAQTSPAGVSANAVAAVFSADDAVAPLTQIRIPADARPFFLPSMYVSLAALQGYDAYSTLRALNQGAVEANPMMRGVVGNPAALFAVKGVATFGSIYAAERLWREHHRGAAIVLMAVTNGMIAVIAARNASVLRARR